ncbi:hypothetical protein [Candidatus Pelagibacter sp.]|uniref:hypothetical protein n=1 Tax=Candidatus Pelagibacter sp. TaxID=2024849 RepID=UPI003F873D9D
MKKNIKYKKINIKNGENNISEFFINSIDINLIVVSEKIIVITPPRKVRSFNLE